MNKLPSTGVDYGEIVSLYFKKCEPTVDAKDVNNLVHHSPYLKQMLNDGIISLILLQFFISYLIMLAHKRIKEQKKKEFDMAVSRNRAMQTIDVTPVTQNTPTLNMNKEEDLVFVKFVSDKHYGWVLRHDLGMNNEIYSSSNI